MLYYFFSDAQKLPYWLFQRVSLMNTSYRTTGSETPRGAGAVMNRAELRQRHVQPANGSSIGKRSEVCRRGARDGLGRVIRLRSRL